MVQKADLKVQRDFGMVNLPVEGTSSEVMIISDFSIQNEQNLQNLESIFVHMDSGGIPKPSLIVICGQFFKRFVMKSKNDHIRIMETVKKFGELLSTYSTVIEDINFFLVPGNKIYLNFLEICDPFLKILPRKPLPLSLFAKLLEKFPRVHLLENPANFNFKVKFLYKFFKGKIFQNIQE